jgi:hypothetical protein
MARFRFSKVVLSAFFLFAFAFAGAAIANAQTRSSAAQLVVPETKPPAPVAGNTTLYCAGYIRFQPLPVMPQIVGAVEEQEQRMFSNGQTVYINAGSHQGIKEGQSFQIIRPRGDVKGVHKQKQGYLGAYVQEVGQLEVSNVGENVSAAQITASCGDVVLLGDMLTVVPERQSPAERAELMVDRFAPSTHKQYGRLMMAKDAREMVTRNDVVYIDLGVEDNVKTGDYLTIYRPLGTGNVTRVDNEEMGRNRSGGFASERYKGGGISSMGTRAKDSNAFAKPDGYYNEDPITTREVKRYRPQMPRKIVGQMVIIDVQTRTATAIITRANGEVHTGDWVEIQ